LLPPRRQHQRSASGASLGCKLAGEAIKAQFRLFRAFSSLFLSIC
jgi:hypothetical protein